MFVRFRRQGTRLQASLIATSRSDARVRQEYVAALGVIADPPTVGDRVEFWGQVHERLSRLANRLDGETQAKILGQLHARVPMATIEDMRGLQLQNSEADEQFWTKLRDLHQENASENRQLLATIQQAIAAADAHASAAGEKAEAAADRVRRLRDGESVPGASGKSLTDEECRRILREAGWSASDMEHARIVATLRSGSVQT